MTDLSHLAEADLQKIAALPRHPQRDDAWWELRGRLMKGGECTGDGPCDTSAFSDSTTDNWVARRGGLPHYIRAVAHALVRDGHDEGSAIPIAISRIKDWAAGGSHVSKETQAHAAAALAEWEAKKASSG